jgi:hypothetical protein
MTLTISVTTEHIECGCARDGSNCPVALALLEAARAQWPSQTDLNVFVNATDLRVWSTSVDNPFDWFLYLTRGAAIEVGNFIVAYDAGRTVDPFTTTLTFTHR